MLVLTGIIQWLHVLLGILWFGGTLFVNFVVIPTVLQLPPDQGRNFTSRLAPNADRVMQPAAILVILLGLIRGTFLGPVISLGFAFGTSYGVTFVIGLLGVIGTALWGKFVTQAGAQQLSAVGAADGISADGKMTPEYSAQLQRVRVVALLELLGFFVVFTCMILMRFGV